jgi:3'(2'), 5'-bisphosphate nucleotidase|tara:strand:- start:3165 stop:4004 length:840 start_codon:yes stop_codon:yes gene_type:complete
MKKYMNSKNKKIIQTIYESGEIASKYFNNKDNKIDYKNDNSPVTKADIEVNEYLEKNIRKIYKNTNFLSEEDIFAKQIQSIEKKDFFIIDPIDGTSSFIEGSKDFTINVSYVKNNILQFSSIYIPMRKIMFFADEKNSFKITSKDFLIDNNIYKLNYINNKKNSILKVITTKRKDEIKEIKKYLTNSINKYRYTHVASSKKFCDLSEGISDIYIRKAKIRLWDVAAGFHIANNAGFEILDMTGKNLFEIFLNKNYLAKIAENDFRIDEFIIKPHDLKIF